MDNGDNSLLKNGRFVRLWIGQGLSFVGDFVPTVALVLLIVGPALEATEDAPGGRDPVSGC